MAPKMKVIKKGTKYHVLVRSGWQGHYEWKTRFGKEFDKRKDAIVHMEYYKAEWDKPNEFDGLAKALTKKLGEVK